MFHKCLHSVLSVSLLSVCYFLFFVVIVQSLSHIWLLATRWTAACQDPLSSTISRSLLKFLSIESVMLSNHLILTLAPFSFCLKSFPASGSFPISLLFASGGQGIGASAFSPFSEYSGLISFRIDWFDLLSVQGTLKNLLQYHNSKAFFRVQLSHWYMTTGKTIALTIGTSVGKVMSLLFNMLSRFVIAFLPRSNYLLVSWLQSPSTVILEPK